jgi:hypothetical protein
MVHLPFEQLDGLPDGLHTQLLPQELVSGARWRYRSDQICLIRVWKAISSIIAKLTSILACVAAPIRGTEACTKD